MFSILSCTGTLSDAVNEGDIEIVEALLKDGLDVNAKDKDGRRALHDAVFLGHTDIEQLLRDAEAGIR